MSPVLSLGMRTNDERFSAVVTPPVRHDIAGQGQAQAVSCTPSQPATCPPLLPAPLYSPHSRKRTYPHLSGHLGLKLL